MMGPKIHIKQRVQPQLPQYHRNLLFLFSCYSLIVLTSVSSAFTQPHSKCHEDERSALMEFRRSFILDCSRTMVYEDDDDFSYPNKSTVASWNKHGFGKSKTSSKDCCTWEGVWCDETTSHVIGLDLGESCLYGYFPQNSSLFKLVHLQHLNLKGNNFKHSLIPQGFGQLFNLISLDLSYSRFSGQIPPENSRLSNLRSLAISHSSYSYFYDEVDRLLTLHNPNLETLLNNLTNLNTLALDFVDVSSTTAPITSHLSNHTSLRWLGLASTNIIGEFPSNIFQLPHLEYIDISHNDHLTGILPEFQQNRSSYKLRKLDLIGTRFFGKLPSSLGDRLINLHYLGLEDVGFTGELPSSFANLTRLRSLYLSDTTITFTPAFYHVLSKLNKLHELSIGPLHFVEPTKFPHCFRNMTKLEYLHASSCQFMGSVPSWLPNLTHLGYLDLAYNNLSATTINIILKLKRLNYLWLDGMSLKVLPNDITHNDTISSNNPQLSILSLMFCNLTEFPEFLKYQHELQELYLSNNSIHGLVPSWLGNTSKDTLQVVQMGGNNLIGFEQSDPAVIIPWKKIRSLDLSDNRLQGSIPIPPISLWDYNLRNNSLIGDIPYSICNNTLRLLDLSYNNLSGRIPKCFDKLGDSLLFLDVQFNMLHGLIPQNFGTSCRLEAIVLSNNQLEGKLPRSLENCSKLQELDAGNNAINDTFPSWLGNLQALQILVLRHNHFHGMVSGIIHPKSNVNFLSLRILDLSNNFLKGSLPIDYWPCMRSLGQDSHYMSSYTTQLSNAVRISYNYIYEFSTTNKGVDTTYSSNVFILKLIDLSSNNFTENIPDSIGNLVGLLGLNFSNNDLTGEIPSSLTNITALEWLDLSHNNLYGKIPDKLIQLTFLEIFNVAYNQLMGPIPHGKQFDTFDISSFEGNPRLCGNPLAKSCKDTDDGLSLPPPLPSTQHDFDWMDWIVKLLGYGSGLVVGIVGGMIFTDKHHERLAELFGRRKRKRRVKRTRRFNY